MDKDNWNYITCPIKTEDESEDEFEGEDEDEEKCQLTKVKTEVKKEFDEEEEAIEDDNEEEPLVNLIGNEEEDSLSVNDPLALPDYPSPSSSSSSKIIKISEGGGGEDLKCPKCNKPFAYRKHLQTHLANHANYEYPCTDCYKIFYKPYNLKRHLEVCPAKKKYNNGHLFAVMCKLCGKGFKKQSLLKEHLAAIHGVGERRKFECEKCGKSFTQKKNLQYHQQVSQNCS